MVNKIDFPRLWTAEQVAEALQMSKRTVYNHAKELGGFYPFGIKQMRFHAKRIQECLERSEDQSVAVQVQVQKKVVLREQLPDRETGGIGIGRKKKSSNVGVQENINSRDNILRRFKQVS